MAASVHICARVCALNAFPWGDTLKKKKKKGKHHVWKLANPTRKRVASPPGAQDVTPPRRDGR